MATNSFLFAKMYVIDLPGGKINEPLTRTILVSYCFDRSNSFISVLDLEGLFADTALQEPLTSPCDLLLKLQRYAWTQSG